MNIRQKKYCTDWGFRQFIHSIFTENKMASNGDCKKAKLDDNNSTKVRTDFSVHGYTSLIS